MFPTVFGCFLYLQIQQTKNVLDYRGCEIIFIIEHNDVANEFITSKTQISRDFSWPRHTGRLIKQIWVKKPSVGGPGHMQQND